MSCLQQIITKANTIKYNLWHIAMRPRPSIKAIDDVIVVWILYCNIDQTITMPSTSIHIRISMSGKMLDLLLEKKRPSGCLSSISKSKTMIAIMRGMGGLYSQHYFVIISKTRQCIYMHINRDSCSMSCSYIAMSEWPINKAHIIIFWVTGNSKVCIANNWYCISIIWTHKRYLFICIICIIHMIEAI